MDFLDDDETSLVSGSTIDQEFLQFLAARLSVATGALGELILEEELEGLGFNKFNFPSQMATAL